MNLTRIIVLYILSMLYVKAEYTNFESCLGKWDKRKPVQSKSCMFTNQ